MDDVSFNHGVLEINVGVALKHRLEGSGCRAMAGTRFRTVGDDFVRPDVAVVCGQPNYTANGRAITNPTVLVEILSPSTANYDLGGKFQLYRQIESLQEYVLVSQTRVLVEVFRRTDRGEWLLSTYPGLDSLVPLQSLKIELPLREVYDGVEDLT